MPPVSHLDLVDVVRDATLFVKLLLLLLGAASFAAIFVCAAKLASGPRVAGGSSYLSALRLGGPTLGLIGATFGLLHMFVGLANVAGPVPVQVLSRGWAEATLLLLAGLVAGGLAVIANWVVEARLDRVILSA
jgi:hypothetical protein